MKRHLYKIRKLLYKSFGGRENYYQNYYYHNIFSRYNDSNSYLSLYKKCTDNNNLKTNVTICLSKSLKFGDTLKDVKEKRHEPNKHIKNITFLNTEILIYKMLIGNHKVKCQMHFFENKLFLYNYTFSYLREHENKEIINILQKKYVSKIDKYAKQNIIDNFNNCIHIEDGVDLTINYLSLKCDFFTNTTLLSMAKEEQQRIKNNVQYGDIYNII